jgi:hypothetical protein
MPLCVEGLERNLSIIILLLKWLDDEQEDDGYYHYPMPYRSITINSIQKINKFDLLVCRALNLSRALRGRISITDCIIPGCREIHKNILIL